MRTARFSVSSTNPIIASVFRVYGGNGPSPWAVGGVRLAKREAPALGQATVFIDIPESRLGPIEGAAFAKFHNMRG